MAKGKTLNPADAQRKAERKKELKKNKTERQKTRDFALVKKDTSSLEENIGRLEKAEIDGVISASQKIQLSAARVELARINKKKEDYVVEHPEHRKLVFRARYKKGEPEAEREEGEGKKKERKVFDKHGIPRHPERSVYYDLVMNPFGVPPPGMPYMERPLRPDEVDSQAGDGSDEIEGRSDDDIAMPSGPPPPATEAQANFDNETEADSDDDIPMPDGPPPLPPLPPPPPLPPLTSANYHPQAHTSPFSSYIPPPPPDFPPTQPTGFPSFLPPNPFPHYSNQPPRFPPPPLSPGFAHHAPGWITAPSRSRLQSNGSMQDPLASTPHQTFQAYRSQQVHLLPNKPTQDISDDPISTQGAQSASSNDTSIISAPAQLRDLKKESTAFMPSSLKRKRAGGATMKSSGGTCRINAAPDASNADKESGGVGEAARPDLLHALKSNFPSPTSRRGSDDAATRREKPDLGAKKGRDDYDKFIEEIGDILDS